MDGIGTAPLAVITISGMIIALAQQQYRIPARICLLAP
jgi:hypothetical protein